MKKIEITDLADNFFVSFSKEWMLVTAGSAEKFNTMTASWGGVGWLWNKPVAFVFIRPERYTHEFVERKAYMTLDFLGSENKNIHGICGTKSGRTVDKIKESGLIPEITELGNITFKQARLTLECRKLYTDMFKSSNFIDKEPLDKWYDDAHGGLHQMYIVEIVNIWVRE